jgi:hypothetical protein
LNETASLNCIGVQGDCAVEGIKARACRCACIEGNRCQREDIALKAGVCAKGCGTANLPEDTTGLRSVDDTYNGITCCGECAAHLEDEDTTGVTLPIEGQSPGKLG